MPKKLKISGPGAADFLTAPAGSIFRKPIRQKGPRKPPVATASLDDPAALEPDLDPPDPALEREREIIPPDRGEPRNA